MSVFVVISRKNEPKIEPIINSKYPNNNYKVSDNEWFISSKETAQQLYDNLGETDKISLIVVSMSSYWGKWSSDLWDWIKIKLETKDG